MNTYIQKKIANMKLTLSEMSGGYKRMVTSMKKLGFSGTLKLIWDDLFAHRSLGQWVYLLILGSFPLWLELIYEHRIVDWTGMICSLTGIICVIFALQKGFYGEVLTTLYFTIMQPIGLLVWIYQGQFKKEKQEFVARKLDAKGWTKYLSLSVLWWLVFGLIYQSVGANRPYRDSITDATNGVGQILMTAVYREQWIFWAATNIFSIYLWWGESLQIQGKYLIYLINSLVGWYQWNKAAKKA